MPKSSTSPPGTLLKLLFSALKQKPCLPNGTKYIVKQISSPCQAATPQIYLCSGVLISVRNLGKNSGFQLFREVHQLNLTPNELNKNECFFSINTMIHFNLYLSVGIDSNYAIIQVAIHIPKSVLQRVF